MNTPDFISGTDLPKAIEAWMGREDAGADYDRQVRGLYAKCVNLATFLLAKKTFRGGMDAMDLASDFLLAMRQEGIGRIENVGGLETAFERHVWRSQNPASAELWGTLSESLRELARQGRIRRVDADWSVNNNNDALWAAGSNASPCAEADLISFEERAEELKHYYPPGARSGFSDKVPKIISPTDARELAEALLQCACGCVTMRVLFGAFRKHVHLFSVVESSNDGDEPAVLSEEDRRHPDTEQKLLELACDRAGTIWETLTRQKLCDVLCGYVLPKVVDGKKVTLESLGKHSVVFDKKEKIMRLLAEELCPEVFAEHDGVDPRDPWHAKLVAEVVSELAVRCEKCAGKAEGSSLPSLETK